MTIMYSKKMRLNMNNSVCALIVTYNRKEYLVKLLHALSEQSYSIKKILIFDNHSSDGTAELLQKKAIYLI